MSCRLWLKHGVHFPEVAECGEGDGLEFCSVHLCWRCLDVRVEMSGGPLALKSGIDVVDRESFLCWHLNEAWGSE